MSSLKMYNFAPKAKGLSVPDGFSIVKFKDEKEIDDWLYICRDGLIGENCGAEKFRCELVELDGPDPYRDTYFIVDDNSGKKIATFTVVPNMWSTGMGYIHMVAVRHEYRGKGLGSFIADYCLRKLIEMGKEKIFLLTGDARFAALSTYIKAGFLPVNYVDENRFDMVDRWQNVVDDLGLESLELLNDDGTPMKTLYKQFKVIVTDEGAVGDGVTDDREAIQRAVDKVSAAGGGVVFLPAGKKFLSGGLFLKSKITFRFGEGAELIQNPDPDGYVKPDGDRLVPYRPGYGHNKYEGIKWSHLWYYNYPLLFAGEGVHDVRITGRGTIRMMDDSEPEKILKICPIGLYRVSNFEVSGIEITNYHSYAMMPFTCDNGLIKDVVIHNWSYGNGDGVCMMNCRDMRIHGCRMFTGDDSVYIFSSYRDPRGGGWWSSDEPQPSENIEIDFNDLKSDHCKAFGMILWGIDCPDLEKVEVRNVYVHDNHFQTMGNWLYNPYTTKTACPPVTHVRFENNRIDAIEPNFFETQISDMNYFHSSREVHNGDFKDGKVFWVLSKNKNDDSVGVFRDNDTEDGSYGFISHLDEGDASLYQGVFIRAGEPCALWAKVKTSGVKCRLFVRELDSGELTASLDFDNKEWEKKSLDFTVPKDANYLVGIESGEAAEGSAEIAEIRLLGNCDAAFGYKFIGMDPYRDWKPLYFYDENLWRD
ncbi:MAG: GNAT family N-acetyltransferase [Clostridiales bacterium]|nr:GNAT family N-acetyltransferase [Clostridiales bacterium]